jgi:hypothetical protein
VQTQNSNNIQYACDAYGHLLPFGTVTTPQAFAALIQQTYDTSSNPRNAYVFSALQKTQGTIKRTRLGGTYYTPPTSV